MHTLYLKALLVWIAPPIAIQWGMGARVLRPRLKPITVAVIIATAWLVTADNVAIGRGIWFFDAAKILGVRIGHVPIEECLFFLFTNLLVAQSIVLWGPKAKG